jgi:hypothetical protein
MKKMNNGILDSDKSKVYINIYIHLCADALATTGRKKCIVPRCWQPRNTKAQKGSQQLQQNQTQKWGQLTTMCEHILIYEATSWMGMLFVQIGLGKSVVCTRPPSQSTDFRRINQQNETKKNIKIQNGRRALLTT